MVEKTVKNRGALYKFWAGQPSLINALRADKLTPRSYQSLLNASVFRNDEDLDIHLPLLILDSFYSQINHCRLGGLCDQIILDSYFCNISRKDAVAYAPFFVRLRERSGDDSLGAKLFQFSAACKLD